MRNLILLLGFVFVVSHSAANKTPSTPKIPSTLTPSSISPQWLGAHHIIPSAGGWQTRDHDWSSIDTILENAIANSTFPGCVAIVADRTGVLYAKPHGHMTYGIPPPFSGGVNPALTLDTRFDMASCTKVLASTSAVALLYQWGHIELDTRIADDSLLGPEFSSHGKGDITIRHCLLHNAGFPPDPTPGYWAKAFGCPESQKPGPPAENFSCRERIWKSLMTQKLLRPVNVAYNYSDLSLITLGFVVGRVAHRDGLITDTDVLDGCLMTSSDTEVTSAAIYQCYFEAFVRKYVVQPLQLKRTGFLPEPSVWGECAPAENNTIYAHQPLQGQVSDGNTYYMGGIAGHAGLFSTAPEVLSIMREWLFNEHPASPSVEGHTSASPSPFLNATTTTLFIREWNHTQSSRALGWNTNDPAVFDKGWNLSCGTKLSASTFTHTGYTGTQVCADPLFAAGPLITILLTNRVYPTDTTGTVKIHATRQAFNDGVATILGA